MRRLFLHTYLLVLILMGTFFSSCGRKDASSYDFSEKVYSPQFARGFDIVRAPGHKSSVIRTKTPWQGAENDMTYLFISSDGEIPPEGFSGQVIDGNARKIVCMSSTQIAMLDAIGDIDRVTGASCINYVSNPYIRKNKDRIKDVGYDGAVDFETLLSLDPDIVFLYGVNGASKDEDKLRQLGIPFVYIGDYLEESPLGKAEWMVAIAEITGHREYGIEVFSEIPERYNAVKELVKSKKIDQKPDVMLNAPYGDSWFMSPPMSYMGQLIHDAGARYVFTRDTGTESVKIDREEALRLLSIADFWLNPGSLNSISEIKTLFPKIASAPCISKKKVYNNTLRLSPEGGNDYFESGVTHPDIVLSDLVKIFYPELMPEYELVYHKQLK